MADFVFSYDGKSDTNVHYHTSHYEAIDISTIRKKQPRFENIKSRYLAAMRQQLQSQVKANNADGMNNLRQLADGEWDKFEADLEAEIVNRYNTYILSPQGQQIQTSFEQAINEIKKAYTSTSNSQVQKSQQLAKGISDLAKVFHANLSTTALFNLIQNGTPIPQNTDIQQLLRVNSLIESAKKIWSGQTQTKGISQALSSVLTVPREAISAAIPLLVDGASWRTVQKTLNSQKRLIGSAPESVTFTGPESYLGTVNQTKAADIDLGPMKVNHTFNINGDEATFDVTVNNTYGSVKYYFTNTDLELVSTSGKNSVVMRILHELYGDDERANYHLYNSLALDTVNRVTPEIDQNFRILRSDIIADQGEKFIVGFNQAKAQRVIIYQMRAYPILALISAIVDEAKTQEAQGNYYGSTSGGDLFTISFSGKRDNTWVPDKQGPSSLGKWKRIQQTKTKINSLQARGKLNLKNFNVVMGKYATMENSIDLSNMVDKEV